jgi:hypothetical protein
MLANVVELSSFAEAGDVGIFINIFVAAPGVVGSGNPRDVFVRQFAVDAVHECAELSRVNKERLASPVTEATILFVPREEPQANGNLRRIEELAWQRDHAVHKVGFDDGLADLTFARLIRRH